MGLDLGTTAIMVLRWAVAVVGVVALVVLVAYLADRVREWSSDRAPRP